ncbi:MAG: xanthine dehydrogenase family protein molybdopterin-binding subunit, partial [Candidatus Eiseniibacteriota bacterium]
MTTRSLGAPVKRNEDARLLSGRALFVDDVELPNLLYAAFVRSPHAHARIRGIDTAAALRRPGIVGVYTADDLGDRCKPGPLVVPPPPIEGIVFNERTQTPLARGKIRYAGEPVAFV